MKRIVLIDRYPIPSKRKNMKNLSAALLLVAVSLLTGCGKIGKDASRSLPMDGQLHGVAPGPRYNLAKPFGMLYVPSGTFHMGPSDEDVNYAYSARNKQISINGFWMDATEITNNEYRQFVNYVKDSIAATVLKYGKEVDGNFVIDWKKARIIKWGDPKVINELEPILYSTDNMLARSRRTIDPSKLVYSGQYFDLKEAAKLRYKLEGTPRAQFIRTISEPIYPDTLVWIRDFTYSYNEPMAKKYFSHPAYGNYPVVGVSWKQATAFCHWRTQYLNTYLESKKKTPESDFRLPTEAEWEYAARGGRSQSMYPWGNYYLRNRKGCVLANFKVGRGNYPEDGGFYTVRADSYWPNDFGLYCMAGNVAEWTSSLFYEGAYNFQHDMNPDIRNTAKDSDPPRMKRKVIRGGSWKDAAFYLQTGTRNYEYMDTAKSYIGFRCVVDLPPMQAKK